MRDLKIQLSSALLMILTAAAVICAILNLQQQRKFRLPEDGVTWVDRADGVRALHVAPESPAAKAGLRPGDLLEAINGGGIRQATEVTKVLVGLGAWSRATYLVHRGGVQFQAGLIIGESRRDLLLYYLYAVGAAYLAIGLFIHFRRASAPKAQHFFILCLASFVFSAFHYTGKLNNFDKVMYFGNVAAGLLAPTIFLHFCLTFPEPRRWLRGRRGQVALYLPAALLLALYFAVTSGVLRVAIPLIELSWLLDRVWVAFLSLAYAAGALALALAHRKARDQILRQQLKWLRNGAMLGVAPFAVLYAVPYALGALPGDYLKLSVLGFALVPVTWAWAIVRYRLMDVDIVFQQGYVYTLATICVLGCFYGLIFSLGKFEDLNPVAAAILILIAAFIFQPIRNWLQEVFDRYLFYKDRYDHRRTLAEFARELSSETDLDVTLERVAERLVRTLSIQRLAFFLLDEQGRFYLEKAVWLAAPGHDLDLSFLDLNPQKPCIFFERTRHSLDVLQTRWPASVRQTVAELDLTYYLPCQVRGRTIAYLGVSRTQEGDFLSSEDVELLVMFAGYLGIAIENARLYSSLQRKAEEYERLKEYSENIVESVHVGVLAADLEDRVEGWNSEIERLTGITRERAMGRPLAELFPAELVGRFDQVRGQTGIHHVYKFPLRLDVPDKVIELPLRRAPISFEPRSGDAGPQAAPPEAVVNIAVTPLITKDQQQIGRVILFDDVTERAELERRLVQADKLSSIGLLAAGVAHEVNTPLAVISTYAQMLARQISGDEQKTRLLEKIARQTFRASEIVNSLLSFSRTSTTAFDEVDLNRVVRETLVLVEHQMEKTGIKIELNLEEQLPVIRGNAGKLQQVFLNLFLNARDAMEGGGVLAIRTCNQGHMVVAEVTDTGHGISPENLARIFDPFFTTKAGRKGTGLGLSVTYGIVREHGGDIEVESRPGQGTSFRLEFPLARKAVHA